MSLGSRELERLIDELRVATRPYSDGALERRIDRLQTAVRALRAAAPRNEGRHELSTLNAELSEPIAELRTALVDLAGALRVLAEASPDVDKLAGQLDGAGERLALLVAEDAWDGLRWLEVHPRSLRLNLTPLDVSATLGGLFDGAGQSWVFTSATLAVGEDFSHFTTRMGLGAVTGLTFPSPFPVADNGLVYLPQGLPQPADRDYTECVLEAVVPLFDMTAGGVFLLFTSHRALNLARRWFKDRRAALGGRSLLVQGSAPRDDLLRRFRRDGSAVLLGTGSFWEGVDVRGSALTVVAIDKLPFASPADPLMMARLEYIRRSGGNGFTEHQVPQAVLALKQGAGRLLRDQSDYGVIVLADPRVTSKNYGARFLEALAPMPTTRDVDDVQRFLARHEARGAVA